MVIYTVEEIVELLGFELHIKRSKDGDNNNMYRKSVVHKDKVIIFTITKSPGSINTNRKPVYRLAQDEEHVIINTSTLRLKCESLEEFNKLLQKHYIFKKNFRDKNIDKILNSDD